MNNLTLTELDACISLSEKSLRYLDHKRRFDPTDKKINEEFDTISRIRRKLIIEANNRLKEFETDNEQNKQTIQ